MALPAKKSSFSSDEYLQREQNSPIRHEYDNGEILALAGGSYEHSLIIANFTRVLGNALQGKPCRMLESNLRIGIPSLAKFVYPDAQVMCGTPQFDPRDSTRQTVVNPRVVIEVLSPSTEAYDRGRKFDHYRELQSFEEYILTAQDRPVIETYFRQADGTWLFSPYSRIESAVKLRSLDVELRLADLYFDVAFPNAPEAAEDLPQL